MNALICGAGNMGIAIGYAMKKLGYNLILLEKNIENTRIFYHFNGECETLTSLQMPNNKPDIIVCALPYFATVEVAEWAVKNNIPYCDLGGSVPTSKAIKLIAESCDHRPVMTDLGLAPGWINIMAEEIYAQLPGANSIKMMVGGIPSLYSKLDPVNYKYSWSIDGLLNEYLDNCEILQDGKITKVEGMSGLENVIIGGYELECFCTSGASAHSLPSMIKKGVKDCVYKTLRWRGHQNVISFLLMGSDLVENKKHVGHILTISHDLHTEPDMVIMHVIAQKGDTSVNKTRKIFGDKKFTAMQKATAFPISVVADIIAKGHLDGILYPSYADIPLDMFNSNLESIFECKL